MGNVKNGIAQLINESGHPNNTSFISLIQDVGSDEELCSYLGEMEGLEAQDTTYSTF